MTTRNLDALFRPRAIALVGASNEPGSVGSVLARNLLSGGFEGPVMPVNPHESAIRSTVNYRSIAELPAVPDLAVVATPPATVPGLIAELAERGCRAAVVITAGFGEGGAGAGSDLRRRMLEAGRPYLMRIVGPNCLGFISPRLGINASFAQLTPPAGDVAFVSQSGAVATTMLDIAAGAGFGFSHVISLGDMADVDFGDLLDYLARDPATRSILLYVESVAAARKFMSAGRIAARAKPVIVVKAGRSAAGAKAARSHTGALAGADPVYEAAFRRAGMLRVETLRELFDAAANLSAGVALNGERLAIVTNGGGLGVMAADALERSGGRLEPLSDALIARLDAVLPRAWSRGNPVDIIGDADGDRYARALGVLADAGEHDAILALNCPTGVGGAGTANAVIAAAQEQGSPPILAAWIGEATAAPERRRLRAAGVPVYETPEDAAGAFRHMIERRRNQALLMEAPPAGPEPPAGAAEAGRALAQSVLADGRTLLTEPEAKRLLALFGAPVVETVTAADASAAGAAAAAMGGPVALKILSRDITHKSDVGGVRLDLEGEEAVRAAADAMRATVAERAPGARLDGFTVQRMVRRPRAVELIVGVADDSAFGPVLLVGQGGVAVEVLGDRAMGLPPLNTVLARDMIARTRVSRLLAGYRDVPPADVDAVVDTLVKLSALVVQVPEVVELDINPLLVDAEGAIALDARVVVRAADGDPQARLAIRPYPEAFVREADLSDGRRVILRPVRPADAAALADMIGRCSADDRRHGFLGAVAALPAEASARLTQIDYDRELVLLAVEPDAPEPAVFGFLRLAADPNFDTADFTLIVRTDVQRRGLGRRMLELGLAAAKARGVRQVVGDVLASSGAMIDLARSLGGALVGAPGGEGFQIRFDPGAAV
jgi:acetyltransferase